MYITLPNQSLIRDWITSIPAGAFVKMLPEKFNSWSDPMTVQLLKLSNFIPMPRKRWSLLYRLLPAYEWNGFPLNGFIKSDQ